MRAIDERAYGNFDYDALEPYYNKCIQKCSTCRRYERMKDNYERMETGNDAIDYIRQAINKESEK